MKCFIPPVIRRKTQSRRPGTCLHTNGTWYTTWRNGGSDNLDYIFIFTDRSSTAGQLEVNTDKAPYYFDLWSGAVIPCFEYQRKNGSVFVPLHLAANQTAVIGWSNKPLTGIMGLSAHVLEAPQTVIGYGMHDCDKRIEVHVGAGQTDRLLKLSNRKSQLLSSSMAPPHFSLSNWTLIAEHWETPTNRSDASVISEKHNATNNLHKLVSWKSIQGFQNASGVGYYTTKLTWLPASNVNVTADGAYLKLPKVTHALRVAVNGEYLPPVDYNAPRMDISKYLHTGQNEILAVVPTTMWNYIRSIFLDITNGGVSSYLVQAGSSYWPSMTDNGLIGNEEVDPIVKLEIEL